MWTALFRVGPLNRLVLLESQEFGLEKKKLTQIANPACIQLRKQHKGRKSEREGRRSDVVCVDI